MQEHITSALDAFATKNSQVRQRHRKYALFLDELKKRSAVLQQYTEDLLERNRQFCQERQTYERQLAREISRLKKSQVHLSRQLTSARQQLLAVCEKKTHLAQVVTSLSATIATFTAQEARVDQLYQHAEKIAKQAAFSEKSDPVAQGSSACEHIRTLAAYADRETQLVKQQIEQYAERKRTVREAIQKTELRITHFRHQLSLREKLQMKNSVLEQVKRYVFGLEAEISSKKNHIDELNEERRHFSATILTHKKIECSAFLDTQRSVNRSTVIGGASSVIKEELGNYPEALKRLQFELSARQFEEQHLKEQLELIDRAVRQVQEIGDSLDNNLEFIRYKVENVELTDVRIEEELVSELTSLKTAYREALVEQQKLRLLHEQPSIDIQATEPEMVKIRTFLIKNKDRVQSEIGSIEAEIEAMKRRIDAQKVLQEGKLAQKDCYESDYESFEPRSEPDLSSNHWQRQIQIRQQQSEVSQLGTTLARRQSFMTCRKDVISTKKALYNSTLLTCHSQLSAFTPTLKRSQRFPQIQNTLDDQIHILCLATDGFQHLKDLLGDQLVRRQGNTTGLEDWVMILEKLQEQAEDLTIWRQLFDGR
jgi:chromosome segregation ATPase